MADLKRILGLRRKYDNDSGKSVSDVESKYDPSSLVNIPLFKDLFQTSTDYKLVSSSPKTFSAIHPDDFGEYFHISREELKAYLKGFKSIIDEYAEETAEETQKDAQEILEDSALDDKDIKLSLYRSFKSLYDKWISNSDAKSNGDSKGYFFNNYGKDDDRFLFDHFNFINRTGGEIGGIAAIDPGYLSNLASSENGQGGPTQSLYQVVTGLLSKNNFDFFPLPSFITYSEGKEEDLKDMFRAFDGPLNQIESKPSFLCMYIGGNSRTLDIPRSRCSNRNLVDFDYVNDSFDINDPSQYPSDFIDSGGITAFKVRYGQEAQNHFISLQLDQAEFKETQESLMVIDALANPKQGSSPSQAGKGNNIYDMYLTRGYSCTVEALGNMMIQPLLYFKLENVPMFRGTYLITNTKHTIKPHSVKTEFKGTRQPIVTAPIVKDPISLLDLVLSGEAAEGPAGTLGVASTGTEATPIISDIDPNALALVESKPPTDAPKFIDIINVMKKKKGTFDSAKLSNRYGERNNKPTTLFKDVKEDLISEGIYKPNESYQILEEEFVVNIVSIRSYVQEANTFDDYLTVFYVDPKGTESYNGKKWTYKAWQITTEPGSTALSSSGAGTKNPLGSAIVAEGQYLGGYETGRHRASEDWNNYSTVRNARNILVYKDGDKDIWAEKDTNKLYVYTCGCNIHASGTNNNKKVVNGWSAGCQVFRNSKDYAEFIYITYFIAQNKEKNRKDKLRLISKGGCTKCSATLADDIPPEYKSVMKDGTVIERKIFNYTLLNSADFGKPSNVKIGDGVYENYINSGMHKSGG